MAGVKVAAPKLRSNPRTPHIWTALRYPASELRNEGGRGTTRRTISRPPRSASPRTSAAEHLLFQIRALTADFLRNGERCVEGNAAKPDAMPDFGPVVRAPGRRRALLNKCPFGLATCMTGICMLAVVRTESTDQSLRVYPNRLPLTPPKPGQRPRDAYPHGLCCAVPLQGDIPLGSPGTDTPGSRQRAAAGQTAPRAPLGRMPTGKDGRQITVEADEQPPPQK